MVKVSRSKVSRSGPRVILTLDLPTWGGRHRRGSGGRRLPLRPLRDGSGRRQCRLFLSRTLWASLRSAFVRPRKRSGGRIYSEENSPVLVSLRSLRRVYGNAPKKILYVHPPSRGDRKSAKTGGAVPWELTGEKHKGRDSGIVSICALGQIRPFKMLNKTGCLRQLGRQHQH